MDTMMTRILVFLYREVSDGKNVVLVRSEDAVARADRRGPGSRGRSRGHQEWPPCRDSDQRAGVCATERDPGRPQRSRADESDFPEPGVLSVRQERALLRGRVR